MKIIPSSRRHHYLARVSTFLIMVALIAGMVGCDGGGGVEYDLTTASSGNGSVTVPGVGTFTYNEGISALLVANPAAGYHFDYWSGDVSTIADVNSAVTTINMSGNYSIVANFAFGPQYIPGVSAGAYHTVGLYSNGFVNAIGCNDDGQCNCVGWMDIIQVAAGGHHTVGLKSNGTAVAVGHNITYGQCDVGGEDWTNITQVAAGSYHTVGLKSNGTVVAVGFDYNGSCSGVTSWTDIIQVAAGGEEQGHTVGLKANGTVVAVGNNASGQCDVGYWTDIIQVAAGYYHTVGLESDYTVVTEGDNSFGQLGVGLGWDLITQVAAGLAHTVGVKYDGTVVVAGCGFWDKGQCNVGSWDLIP